MISKKNRFPMRTQFLEFRDSADKLYSKRISIYYKQANTTLLAVVVPKKLNKKAVVRNKIKRKIKSELIKLKNIHIVVFLKPINLNDDEIDLVYKEFLSLLKTLSLKIGMTTINDNGDIEQQQINKQSNHNNET